MRQWETTDKDDGALLRGSLLSEAEAWQQQRLAQLSQEERVFIQLSLALRDKETDEREQMQQRELALVRQARTRLRWLVTVLSAIALGTTGVVLYPYIWSWRAASLNPLKPIPRETFQIEQYEVSNRQYRLCVETGKCSAPATEPHRYYDESKLDYPVVGITAIQAAGYCRWLGRRLPTEREWERAARGAEDRRWPWGDTAPTLQRANILLENNTRKEIEPVKSYPDGVSLEGIYNLVGNVGEWTASYYFPEDSNSTEQEIWDGNFENLLPKALTQRGGSWTGRMLSIMDKVPIRASPGSESTGVRCAK
jgi:formylglycine-generating enzyme required for sulfatase activity